MVSWERERAYVSIGWTQDAMLFRWARQKRSRRTVSARAIGLSLIVEVPRSINSICSGAEPAVMSSEETGVILEKQVADRETIEWSYGVDCRPWSRTSMLKTIDGTILSMCFHMSFCNSSLAVLRINAWCPRRPRHRNLSEGNVFTRLYRLGGLTSFYWCHCCCGRVRWIGRRKIHNFVDNSAPLLGSRRKIRTRRTTNMIIRVFSMIFTEATACSVNSRSFLSSSTRRRASR